MPSDASLKLMNAVHRAALKVSGGRLGRTLASMPALELTTTGRRSGQPRSIMLTSPVQEGEALVIVASRGGDDHHPAWFLNLQADPAVTVTFPGSTPRPMRARIATDAERDRLWPQVTHSYRGYAGYQKKTDRVIPLVFLEPVAG